MIDADRPTPTRRRPRAAADETGPDVAEVAPISPSTPSARSEPTENAPVATVQLNTRISEDLYDLVRSAKYERRTTIREVVEHALRTTYSN